MPPLRLSTGRAVNPLQRPPIARARELTVEPPDIYIVPPPAHLHPRRGADPRPFRVRFEAVSLHPLPFESQPTAIHDLEGFRIRVDPQQPIEARLDSVGVEALQFAGSDTPSSGPAAMPSLDGEAGPEAAQNGSSLARLRHFLQPSIKLLDGPAISLEGQVNTASLDAIGTLHEVERVLFADPPGTGKRMTVALALRQLIRSRTIGRALILVPRAERRIWVEELQNYAPDLLINVIQGTGPERRKGWGCEAHLYLADYASFLHDLQADDLPKLRTHFDAIVMDMALAALSWSDHPLTILDEVDCRFRWALAGGKPRSAVEWKSLFGVLTPGKIQPGETIPLAEFERRLGANLLLRTKSELSDGLPRRLRRRLWLDLELEQREAYDAILAEERHRLAKLGSSVTRGHIAAAELRLTEAADFLGDSLEGVKVQALLDRLREIESSGNKAVVFCQNTQTLEHLYPALEVFGALRLPAGTSEASRGKTLDAFEANRNNRVLLADVESRTDGRRLPMANYLIHFDHSWNPVVRLRAEHRLHWDGALDVPLDITEFWTVDTVEHRLHDLLESRGLGTDKLSPSVDTSSLDRSLSIEDWLQKVFEVPMRPQVRRPVEPARPVAPARPGTGLLPGTTMLRSELDSLDDERFLAGVELFMQALGFLHAERLAEGSGSRLALLARRTEQEADEAVLVHCIRTDKNVGVAEGRALLKELDPRPELIGGFLLSSTDFTAACRKLADESEGRLGLIAGTELARHLHILGWFEG